MVDKKVLFHYGTMDILNLVLKLITTLYNKTTDCSGKASMETNTIIETRTIDKITVSIFI